jgi:exopolyphosphatase / guanosine-5'-triphosphate,3'-diphosphate pyrophosphatase
VHRYFSKVIQNYKKNMIIASIDIGTNTIILLIAKVEVSSKKIIPLYNEQRIPRIGKGLAPGKPILKEKINELLLILENYNSIIKKFNCEKIIITATYALRIASNKDEIKKIIKEKFNFDVNIVSGEDEADLTFKGAVYLFEDKYDSLVIDIGGGSTEIILGNITNIQFKKSFQIGVVSFKEKYFKDSPPSKKNIENLETESGQVFSDLKEVELNFKRVIAIAGTPTTLAAIKLNLTEYDEEKLEGFILKDDEIKNLISELSKLNEVEILQKYKSVVKGREDVILSGAIILFQIMKLLKIDKISISTKGIRYGAICKELFNL